MKPFFVLSFLAVALCSIAQTTQKKQSGLLRKKGAYHLPASKTLIGIWRQTGVRNPWSGEVVDITSGNYKVINPDGTFYTFVTWNTGATTIGQYGSYKIESDSTLTEHIVMHTNPELKGENCAVKFKMIDANTVMMAWSFDKKKWTDERWTRLSLPQ